MFSRFGYLFRETGNNLRRNTTLFLATIVAVWVSLAMFGSAIIINDGVGQATGRWSDGIQFIVFMKHDATPEQYDEVERSIVENPEIELVEFVDQQRAYEELLEEYGDENPAWLEPVTPESLPPSFRVRPISNDAQVITDIAVSFRSKPGVLSVQDAPELLNSILETSQKISTFILVASIVVLIAAILLIINTIRTAVSARRNDIEIMKLVGAPNWYIRVPFILEGTIQGLIGGILAVPVLFLLNNILKDFVSDEDLVLLQSLLVENSFVWNTSIYVLLLGAGIGALGSGFVVGRYVDV